MSAETVAVPGGLNSPPDSNKVLDEEDSELSELEDEKEDEKEESAKPAAVEYDIEPEYYSKDGVPVFIPTMEQFEDFTLFMHKIHQYGMKSGIVKVIPPKEWKDAQPRLDELIKTIRVKEPIKQDIMGTSGTYRQANMVHSRSYNLPQWRQLCEESQHQPPAPRGQRRVNQEKPTRSTPRSKANGGASTPTGKRVRGRPMKGTKARAMTADTEEGQITPDRLPTPVSPSAQPGDANASVKDEHEDEDESPVKGRMGGRQPKASVDSKATVSVSSRRKNNRREQAGKVDEAAFKDFDYDMDMTKFTADYCDYLENQYWKSLTFAQPLYGADMPGTLFDERTQSWNLGKLENILDALGSKIPGVNTAYLYLGMWKATFAWHLEDVDLYSINYVHFGAPKQWYSIAQGDARRFEAAMKTIWPTDAKACDQFLRHKTFLISPSHLLSNFNIKVNKIVAMPGEFVITFPYGYHSGYNLGYNCAEAVNFGLEEWLPYGRVAKKCECDEAQDSVWINVEHLERKMRGEDTEYEETDDEDEEEEEDEIEDENSNLSTIQETSGAVKTKPKPKKRKRPINDKGSDVKAKKIRVRIKLTHKEPCILCPNDIPSEPLLPTEDGNHAHRICAQYVPETSIDNGKVFDLKYIQKGRWDLKCIYCRSKKGACFQCSRKKCTRAYHATCAAAAGVFVEQGEIPVFGEDGTEYKEWGVEFSCRFHRTKRDKKLEGEALSESVAIRKAAADIEVGEVCQLQYHKGDIFAGAVVENRKDEEMLLVDILPRGDRVEVEYKWLLVADPSDYHLPKPSANAIPMPKSRKDKASLNTSKRQADDLPRPDDLFGEGYTWAEFNRGDIAANQFQVKVDFKKENQTWFYLGKTSTEARAQYTEDLSKKRHNPKGNFLDTIPKPAPAPPRQSYAASYPSNAKNARPTPILPPASRSAVHSSTPSSSLSRPLDKPYVYKPRNENEAYRVDQNAYRSQQNFLNRSAPQHSFGTDPRWKSADLSAQSNTSGYGNSTGNYSTQQFAHGSTQGQYRPAQSPVAALIQDPPIHKAAQSQASKHAQHMAPQQASQSLHSIQLQRTTQAQHSFQSQHNPQGPSTHARHSSQVQPAQALYTPQAPTAQAPQASTQYNPKTLYTPQAPKPQIHAQMQSAPKTEQSQAPQVGSRQSAQYPSKTQNSPYTSMAQNSTVPYIPQTQYKSTTAQFSTPSHYRPPQASPAPPKPNNPFGTRPQTTRPTNVFAKYAYLQKEHNRSPLEYKSPYRPGGGFMNGYQGNLEKHLAQTMFTNRSSGSLPSPAASAYNSMRPPHAAPQMPASGSSYGSSYSASYSSQRASPVSSYAGSSPSMKPNLTTPATPATTVAQSPTTWDKEAPQLHPAIRQEYHKTLLQQQFIPPPPNRSPTQSRSSVLQPPPLFERPPYPPTSYVPPLSSEPQTFHNPSTQTQYQMTPQSEHVRPVTQSLSASHPQSYRGSIDQPGRQQQSSPSTYGPLQQFHHASMPKYNTPQETSVTSMSNSPRAPHSPTGNAQQPVSTSKTRSIHATAPVNPAIANNVPATLGEVPATAPDQTYHSPTPVLHPDVSQLPLSKSASSQVSHPPAKMQAVPTPSTSQSSRSSSKAVPAIDLPPNYKPTPILPPPKQYQAPVAADSGNKSPYPHQQSFQNPITPVLAPQQEVSDAQTFEPADVPPNSSALIEEMMANLRKARP